jgi:hypothetical protein
VGDGLAHVLGRQAQGLLAELDLGLTHAPAQEHLVAGGGLAVGPPLGAEEADVTDVVLAARVRAAGDVDADAAHLGQARVLEGPPDVVGEAPALGDGQVAGVGARARHHVAGQLGAGLGHADGVEAAVELGELGVGEAPEHHVLAVGDPHLGAQVALDGGQGPELVGGDVAQAGEGVGGDGALGHAPHHVDLLPLAVGVALPLQAQGDRGAHRRGPDGDVDSRGPVALLLDQLGHAAGPGGAGQQETALLEDPGPELVDTEGVDEPLHAGAQLVVAVAVVVEDPEDRLEGGQQVVAGGELLEGLGGMGVGAQAAGDEHPEPGLDGAVFARPGDGHHADVVEHGLATVRGAAREVDLELAGQPLGDRVADEVAVGGLGPRADVEHLEGAGTGQVAAGDVPDGVAARLPGGEPHARQVAQHLGDPLEGHVVELDVLAGGDVAPAPAVGVGDVAEHLQLVGREGAVGDLDPHHLVVSALALPVDPVVEPEDAEDVVVELAGQVQGELRLELLDVPLGFGADLASHGHGGVLLRPGRAALWTAPLEGSLPES